MCTMHYYSSNRSHCTVWQLMYLRWSCFQMFLLVWIFSCTNENCHFVKETDTPGYIVVWTIYTSHTGYFTPIHTVFSTQQCAYQSFWLLPGLISFISPWLAGWTLEKNNQLNMNYSYPNTIYESIFAQIYIFLVEKHFFSHFVLKMFSW